MTVLVLKTNHARKIFTNKVKEKTTTEKSFPDIKNARKRKIKKIITPLHAPTTFSADFNKNPKKKNCLKKITNGEIKKQIKRKTFLSPK